VSDAPKTRRRRTPEERVADDEARVAKMRMDLVAKRVTEARETLEVAAQSARAAHDDDLANNLDSMAEDLGVIESKLTPPKE
jgi:hypothetical protein